MQTPRYPYVQLHVPAEESETICDTLWMLGAQGIEERDSSTLIGPGGIGAEGKGPDRAPADASKNAPDDAAVTPVTLVTLVIASFLDEETAGNAADTLRAAGRYAEVTYVVGDEWRDGWRKYFKPTLVSPRILVRPSWEPAEAEDGIVILTIDPGNAFGSGLHETTRLVLREVDARIQGGERVLDVGCGSGILSVAALLLGAKSALGTDTDPIALDTSMENAEINKVADQMTVTGPDLDEIHETFPLVLANIQAHVLIPMAGQLLEKLETGGTLILSGVLGEREKDVCEAFVATGLTLEKVESEGEWRAIVLQRG